MNLNRHNIIEGGYKFPEDFIKLKTSRHFKKRLEERGLLEFIPTTVRVTKNNIYSGKTEDGKTLSSVTIRLDYTSRKWLFLAIAPDDGTVKTLWFNDKKRKTLKQDSQQAV